MPCAVARVVVRYRGAKEGGQVVGVEAARGNRHEVRALLVVLHPIAPPLPKRERFRRKIEGKWGKTM